MTFQSVSQSSLAGWMIPAFGASSCRESSSYPLLISVVGCNSASSDGPRFSLTVFSATPLSALSRLSLPLSLAVSARRLLCSALLSPPCVQSSIVGQAQWSRPRRFPTPTQAQVKSSRSQVKDQVPGAQVSHQPHSHQIPPTRALDLATPTPRLSPAPAFLQLGLA